MSLSPKEIADEIRKHIPNFNITYKPDFRQAIAKSWSESIDDSTSRVDWNWKPSYDLSSMTVDMLGHLSQNPSIIPLSNDNQWRKSACFD